MSDYEQMQNMFESSKTEYTAWHDNIYVDDTNNAIVLSPPGKIINLGGPFGPSAEFIFDHAGKLVYAHTFLSE